MKKSMVLLIALFFIGAISILIYKNLDDTNSYIKAQNHKLNKAQVNSLLKNVYEEVTRVIDKYEDNLEPIYGQTFPLVLKDVELSFTLNSYDKQNINDICKALDSPEYQTIRNFFYSKEINDVEILRNVVRRLQNGNCDINSNKQVDAIISDFIKESYNKKILEIRDEIGFLKIYGNEKLNRLDVNIIYLNELIKASYILSKDSSNKSKVRYFELSFK